MTPAGVLGVLGVLLGADEAAPTPSAVGVPALLEMAEALDARGLLYANLRRRDQLALLPPVAVADLRGEYAATTACNLASAAEAEAILEALERLGLSVEALKGVGLFRAGARADLGARPTLDIDLLTARADRAAVIAVLHERGYAQTGLTGPPKHLPAFTRPGHSVEIHELAYWSRDGAIVDLAGYAALERSGPLTGVAVHLVHHLFRSSVFSGALAVKTLADMAAIAEHLERGDGGDGGDVTREAQRVGFGHELALLGRALRALGRRVPDGWCSGGGATDEDVAAFFRACTDTSPATARRRELAYWMGMVRGSPPALAASALRHAVFPARTAMEALHDLPPGSARVWPAYLVRPVRLSWRAISALRGMPFRR